MPTEKFKTIVFEIILFSIQNSHVVSIKNTSIKAASINR